jgi:hypothetical protein
MYNVVASPRCGGCRVAFKSRFRASHTLCSENEAGLVTDDSHIEHGRCEESVWSAAASQGAKNKC